MLALTPRWSSCARRAAGLALTDEAAALAGCDCADAKQEQSRGKRREAFSCASFVHQATEHMWYYTAARRAAYSLEMELKHRYH